MPGGPRERGLHELYRGDPERADELVFGRRIEPGSRRGFWSRAQLAVPANRLAWQQWRQRVEFPGPGYYEICARATDARGTAQPMVVPGWNPKGYLNNACHRVAVRVG